MKLISAIRPLKQYIDERLYRHSVCGRTGKTITVYKSESLDNLKKGAGHFEIPSVGDTDVALCGQNRGPSAYLSFVKDMKNGTE